MSPGIFWTGGLFKTLWNHDQAYLEPCHRALICHIQSYSEPCVTLAYAETSHTRNPGIFRTLPYLHPNPYSEACHIKGNLQIFRTLTYLKPDTYLEPSQRFKMEILAKIVKKTTIIFPKCSQRVLNMPIISPNKYSLTCWMTSCYILHDTYSEPCLLS